MTLVNILSQTNRPYKETKEGPTGINITLGDLEGPGVVEKTFSYLDANTRPPTLNSLRIAANHGPLPSGPVLVTAEISLNGRIIERRPISVARGEEAAIPLGPEYGGYLNQLLITHR